MGKMRTTFVHHKKVTFISSSLCFLCKSFLYLLDYFDMSLAHSAITETEDTFNSQLDQLERRNNLHAKFSQVKDRTKVLVFLIYRLIKNKIKS